MKIYTGESYLIGDEGLVKIKPYYPGVKLKKGKGYIIDGYVLIYRGKKDDMVSTPRPGIYKMKVEGVTGYDFVFPRNEMEEEEYSIDSIVDMSLESISNVDSEETLNLTEMEVINNNGAIYKPTIKPDDDFLKKAVKQVILSKEISLNNYYKNKFPASNGLNNYRSGLEGTTKLSTTKFDVWAEVLGFKYRIIIEDDGTDTMNPLEEEIVISSDDV